VTLPEAGVKDDLLKNLKIASLLCFSGGCVLFAAWLKHNKRKKAAE
jgi:hypothetical protein